MGEYSVKNWVTEEQNDCCSLDCLSGKRDL